MQLMVSASQAGARTQSRSACSASAVCQLDCKSSEPSNPLSSVDKLLTLEDKGECDERSDRTVNCWLQLQVHICRNVPPTMTMERNVRPVARLA